MCRTQTGNGNRLLGRMRSRFHRLTLAVPVESFCALSNALGVLRAIQTMPVERTHRGQQLTLEHICCCIRCVHDASLKSPGQDLWRSIKP
jgi:hypothetical protein